MRPPIRSQSRPDAKRLSQATVIRFDPSQDRARQEFKAECDVSTILRRFGADLPQRVPAPSSVVDFDADLLTMFQTADRTREAHARLPAHIRSRFPTWIDLVTAIGNGEDVSLPPPVEAPAVVPPVAPPAAASDSAPVPASK